MGIFDQPTIETPVQQPNIAPTGVNLDAVERLKQVPATMISQPEQPSISWPTSKKPDGAPGLSLEDRVVSYADRLRKPRTESFESTNSTQAEPPLMTPKPVQGKDQISAMMSAIGEMESGGRYGIVGGVIPSSGDRAYGKYQVMGANVPSWTKEALGVSMTPQQFLKTPSAQDAVARFKMNQYYQKFGNIQDVAAVWLSGRPLANNASKDQVTGISVPQYARRVLALYDKYSGGQPMNQSQTRGPAGQFPNIAEAMFRSTGKMTTHFGGSTRFEQHHPAVDLAAEPGKPIRAFTPGVVVAKDEGKKQGDKGYGNYVVVKDPYGNLHRYSHLQDSWVKVGQKVFTGDDLGSMGNSGSTYSTSGGSGTHLDYRIADAAGKYINPMAYLNSINQKS